MTRLLLPIVLWLVCLAGAGGWIGQAFEVSHDLAAFLPDRGRPVERLLISKANRGAISRTVLAGFAGGSLEQRLAASREAGGFLRQQPDIEQVAHGAQGLDLNAFERLFAYRYLLAGHQVFDADSLHAAFEARLKELRSPLGSTVKQTLAGDPTASFRTLLLAWHESHTLPEQEQGLWVTSDRERALLLAVIGDSEGDHARDASIIPAITETLKTIAEHHDVELLLAGRPVLVAEARESVRASLVFGSIAASGLVILLLLWIYRSFGVLLLGILPLLSGVLAGLFAVLVLFGPVHGIVLAFGVTLLGIAIDYPLHLFSHGRRDEPLALTARHLQRPILLGALTTAGMFAVFGAGSAPGLGQLACFAGVGILTAALTLRYVVPNIATLLKVEPTPRMVDLLPASAPRALMWLVMIAALGAALQLISRHDRLFESDVGVLNPLPEAAKQLDRTLRSDLGAPDLRHLFLISADDAEIVLERAETLAPGLEEVQAQGGIAGFDTPSRYLPSLARQAERQAALPPPDQLATALDEARQEFPFKDDLFAAFLEAVETSRNIDPLGAEAGLRLFNETPLGAKLDQLLIHADQRWYGFLPISGVGEIDALQALADESGDIELIDLKALSEDTLSAFREEALFLLALGFGVILLLLAAFRYPPSVIAEIVLVLILSIVVTTAALSLIGEKLTMLHILAGLLVVGLGLDYTIFFSWPDADRHQQKRTRHALLVCVLSTVIVFGLLACSNIGLLRAIGLTVALGACTTFAIAYAMLSRPHEDV